MVTQISSQDFELWKIYIKNLCGNDLDSSKKYLLETRLSYLLEETKCTTWTQFYSKVLSDGSGQLNTKIVNAITTNETSFFRDASPFELLQFKIIPDLIDARRKQFGSSTIPIRIWSAACSTGQEVYSTAIVIREIVGDLKGYDVRILGTDISNKVMAQASYGKYSKLEIERGLEISKINRYFLRDGEQWRVKDEVRAMATFKIINLLSPFSFPTKFDIVFCRNVAIYFSEDDKKSLFNKIANVLSPDGYLIIGSTESITSFCPQYESKRYLRSVYYQLKHN